MSIVDAMIIYSVFGHSHTSRNQTVVNNYYVDNSNTTEEQNETEIVAVPEGTTVKTIGKQQYLIVPTEKDGEVEEISIPQGSTFTTTEQGVLIQTPDGRGVLIPKGDQAYNAPKEYKVPDYADKPVEYDEPADLK